MATIDPARGSLQITRLTAVEAEQLLADLAALLQDAVAGGASLGFLPPLASAQASAYWQEAITALRTTDRVLLIATLAGEHAGTVQLDPAARPNGSHRAEVAKLMVHSRFRRQGIGRALMQAVETEARRMGRTTLVLDTRKGDASELLYGGLGYLPAGTIPEYARSADGSLHTTIFMYKLLR